MTDQDKRHRWIQEADARRRNYVFPDTTRNMGFFWGGLYRQKLNLPQVVGLGILFVFYLGFISGLILETWPKGSASVWQKIIDGYWIYFLMCLPIGAFFLFMGRMARHQMKSLSRSGSNEELK